jgi:F-type H+-transporting ATPase subunit a
MTLALALIAVVMTQVLGVKRLGLSYFTKFFNFKTLFTSPLGGIDVAVGLLELIGEFAKILSFSFRLLGNVFAGSVLLFVMSFLLPFLPWPFFILEFFVGIIQALVFGLLTAIFMSQATASHSHDEEHEHAEAH